MPLIVSFNRDVCGCFYWRSYLCASTINVFLHDAELLELGQVCVVRSAHRGPVTSEYNVTGSTYAPEGIILDGAGLKVCFHNPIAVGHGCEVTWLHWKLYWYQICKLQLEHPADLPCLLHLAMCSSLCNESSVQYNTERGIYEKIGESTEVALRVLSEKVVTQVLLLAVVGV